MKAVFKGFSELLIQRFAERVLTTEDSVRFTMFASMLQNNITPQDVILEYPHPTIMNAKLDTWLPSFHGKSVAIEFKYDREIPSGWNQPKPQKAGSIFNDLHRLLLVETETKATCYFVYLTTNEMAIYFNNPNNGHSDFFQLQPGQSFDIHKSYFASKPASFMNKLGEVFEARITNIVFNSLDSGHELRIYKVQAR